MSWDPEKEQAFQHARTQLQYAVVRLNLVVDALSTVSSEDVEVYSLCVDLAKALGRARALHDRPAGVYAEPDEAGAHGMVRPLLDLPRGGGGHSR